jgi:serine/threonine protein kinase
VRIGVLAAMGRLPDGAPPQPRVVAVGIRARGSARWWCDLAAAGAVTDLRGRVLTGRYELSRVLGAGGMATVYQAHDRLLRRTVAVKVLDPSPARDPSLAERFRAEARTAARLHHPNVVAVFDAGTDDGVHYLVMEHLPGPSLAKLVHADGPLPPQRAAELASQVCAALGAAHAQRVVHRDVKPGNVLLDGDGRAKVTDFGIAKAAGSPALTAHGVVVGSPAYMAPEQAQGRPADARSDLYAVGCLLYQLLTGTQPFGSAADSHPVAVARRQVTQPPEPPSHRNPQVDAAMDAVVLTAMAKQPDHRYQSAMAMRDALARLPTGPAATARLVGAEAPTEPLPTLPPGARPAAAARRPRRPTEF